MFTNLVFVSYLSLCFSQNVPINYTERYVSRVVNGWRATQVDAPYQVALKTLISRQIELYGTYCGAVIVGPDKLITAAHCVLSEKAGIIVSGLKPTGYIDAIRLRAVYAVAGNLENRDVVCRTDSVVKGQWRSIDHAYYPREYMFPMHDIALAYTETPFQFNEYVAPINVASRNTEYLGPCLVSGYGRISAKSKASHLILAYLDIMPTSLCSKVHQRNMDSYVCSSTKVSDVAQGDSGGPLVCSYTHDPEEGKFGLLVGIVSGHRPTAGSFFTRVSKYKHFIDRSYSSTVHNNNIFRVSLIMTLIINEFFFLF